MVATSINILLSLATCWVSGDMGVDTGNIGDRQLKSFSILLLILTVCFLRFGESSIYRIVRWIKKYQKIAKSSSFLDIGCGNGILLVNLVWYYYLILETQN